MTIPGDVLAHCRTARNVLVVTGAGVSAESGIPTFRDAMDGLWAQYDPMELATPEAFAADPARVAAWYRHRMETCGGAKPNAAHHALARWQSAWRAWGRRFVVLTQNVDRLHQAAGSDPVVELHGTLWVWRCTACEAEVDLYGRSPETWSVACACGAPLRPGVVWFGEALPAAAVREADRALAACDLFLSVGTSAVVYPAAGWGEEAVARGLPVLEINPEETPLTARATWARQGKAGAILPEVVEAVLSAEAG